MTKKNSSPSLRLDGYIRVSDARDRDTESWHTVEDQREKVERWAIGHGHEIIHWETDIDETGTKLVRPGLDKILGRIRTKQTDGIVVAYLSRLSRAGVGDALKLIDEITTKHGATLGCYSPQIDTADPVMGRFILTIFLALNVMESARIGEQWSNWREKAIANGQFIGSVTQFGYRQRDDGRLEVNPVTAPIAAEVFARRAAAQSLTGILGWILTTGTVAPGERKGRLAKDNRTRSQRDLEAATTGGPWTIHTVNAMLRRREYLGEVRSGEHVKEGAHPAIVDPVTWQAAQNVKSPRWTNSGEPPLLLAGSVRCAGCRYMAANFRIRSGRDAPTYCCKRKNHDMCPDPFNIGARSATAATDVPDGYCQCGCGQKTSTAKMTNAQRGVRSGEPHRCLPGHAISTGFVGLDDYVTTEMWKHLHKIEAEGYGTNDELEELQAAVKSAKAEEVAWATDPQLAAATSREVILAGLEARHANTERAEAELAQAMRTATRPLLDKPVRQLRWEFENEMTDEDRRAFMAGMVQAVFVRAAANGGRGASADRVDIVWFDDAEPDVPRQGRRDYVQRPWVFANHADDPGDVRVAAA